MNAQNAWYAYHPEQGARAMTRKPRSLNADHRDKRKMLAKLLNDSLAAGDTIAFVRAIGDMMRAQGMTEVSQKTGLNRAAWRDHDAKH